MESTQVCLIVFGLVLFLGAQSSLSLECYICNSASIYEGKKCEDAHIDYLLPCSGGSNGTDGSSEFKYCRKLEQTVHGEYRVIRSCAQEARLDKCIERTGTNKVKVKYCECEGDGCNSAVSNTISVFMIFSVIASLMFLRS